jgi:fucose permease
MTWACYGGGTCWGYIMYGYSAVVPMMLTGLGIDKATAGLHGTAFAIGLIIAALAIAPAVARLGRRGAIVAGLLLGALGTCAMALGPSVWVTVPGAALAAVGTQTAMSVGDLVITLHQRGASGAALSEATLAGSLVNCAGPLLAALSGGLGWGWRPVIAFGALLDLAMALWVARLPDSPVLGGRRPPRPSPALAEASDAVPSVALETQAGDAAPAAGAHRPAPEAKRLGLMIAWALALVAGVVVETSTSYWAATLIQERDHAAASIAGACVAATLIGQILGRAAASRLALRFGAAPLVLGAVVVSAAGWLVLWSATAVPLAVTGLAVLGAGIGPFYPLTLSRALAHTPLDPDRTQGIVQLMNGVGTAPMPFLLGWFSDQWGVHQAFLVIPLLLVLLVAATAIGAGRARSRAAR